MFYFLLTDKYMVSNGLDEFKSLIEYTIYNFIRFFMHINCSKII